MFTKGISGNPSGRPKVDIRFKEHGPEAVARLLFWMRQSKLPKVSLHATQLWLAYWLGKPSDLNSENIIPVLQNVINEQAVLKLIYAHNFTDEERARSGDPTLMASGSSSVQTGTRPA
jgi:hypothetical protein